MNGALHDVIEQGACFPGDEKLVRKELNFGLGSPLMRLILLFYKRDANVTMETEH